MFLLGGSGEVHSGELGISPNTGRVRQTRTEGVGLRARVLSGAHTPSKQASKQEREREREREKERVTILAQAVSGPRIARPLPPLVTSLHLLRGACFPQPGRLTPSLRLSPSFFDSSRLPDDLEGKFACFQLIAPEREIGVQGTCSAAPISRSFGTS